MSLKTGSPFVFINDSGGARVQEGIDSLSGYGRVFYNNVMLSGTVPQISLICGPCAGGAAYSPALTDFIIQTRKAQMFITGPQVIKQVTGEVVTAEELGGPQAQMNNSGVVHLVAAERRRGHVPLPPVAQLHAVEQPGRSAAPAVQYAAGRRSGDERPVPVETKIGYDMRGVIARVLDHQDFLEIQPGFAPNIVVGFGRIAGPPGGDYRQPARVLAGALDINASDKAARFIRFCNAFNIPLITFVDVPGFPARSASRSTAASFVMAPRCCSPTRRRPCRKSRWSLRKAYGGAYLAMCGKDLGADRVVAWPTAEIAVMGAEGAAEIVFRREIDAAQDKGARAQGIDRTLSRDFRNSLLSPLDAGWWTTSSSRRKPGDTLAQALESLHAKRELRPPKKHGLIPL